MMIGKEEEEEGVEELGMEKEMMKGGWKVEIKLLEQHVSFHHHHLRVSVVVRCYHPMVYHFLFLHHSQMALRKDYVDYVDYV
jgi:hypothetical protein